MSIKIPKGIAPQPQRVRIEKGIAPPPQPTQRVHIMPQPRIVLPSGHPPLTPQQQASHDRLKAKWAEKRCSLPHTCPLCRREIENSVYEASSSDCEFHCSWPDCEYEWR